MRHRIAYIVVVLWSLWTNRIHGWADYTVIPTAAAAICGTASIFYSEKSNRRHISLCVSLLVAFACPQAAPGEMRTLVIKGDLNVEGTVTYRDTHLRAIAS